MVYAQTLHRFNSMKVRLKPMNIAAGYANKFQFQFHEGPIKTRYIVERCPG